uniref:COMM domain containing 8 n=1 Tax=Takifugu rubripes TaxID=31033 RepID=H2SB19_TAKRU
MATGDYVGFGVITVCSISIKCYNPYLCHRVVDGLCGQQPPTRADYSSTWTLEEWTELNNSLISLFRLAVYNNSSDEKVVAVLSSVGNSHTDAVLSVLRARREEIHTALLNRTNSISFATLQDFDWQLKLAISSDKMASLHIPLLSLGLSVKENGILRPVAMEMDREELNMLLGSLDAANKVEITLHLNCKQIFGITGNESITICGGTSA